MSFNIQNSSLFGIVLEWISDVASKKVQIALSIAFILLAKRAVRYYQGLSVRHFFIMSSSSNVYIPIGRQLPTSLVLELASRRCP